MYLIKDCQSCGKKIRFPINKGKIKVTCSCGYSFIADPDDIGIYDNASFDLNIQQNKRGVFDSFLEKISPIRLKEVTSKIINGILNYKYSLQNFRLQPASEKRRIIFSLMVFFLAAVVILYLIVFLTSLKKSSESIII